MARCIVIDSSGIAYRHYHARIKQPLYSPSGEPTSVPYGYLKTRESLADVFDPIEFIVHVFDMPGEKHRVQIDPSYKQNRQPTPQGLTRQLARTLEIVELIGELSLGVPSYEADDVIASLVSKFKSEFDEMIVVSIDKDLLQLVDEKVKVYRPFRMQMMDIEAVHKVVGVAPEHVAGWLALVGDQSDNVRGVKGIGKKTAVKLLRKFGSFESVVDHLSPQDSMAAKHAHSLVQLYKTLELKLDVDDIKKKPAKIAELERVFQDLGFNQFLEESSFKF